MGSYEKEKMVFMKLFNTNKDTDCTCHTGKCACDEKETTTQKAPIKNPTKK